NGAHIGYNCPPKVLIISNPEPCYNPNVDEFPQTLPSFHPTCYSGDENSFTYDSNLNFVDDSPNPPPQPPTDSYAFCGNDAHYSHDLLDLVLIPSESEGIPDNMCDVPFRDNSPPLDISKDQFEDFCDSNDDSTWIDDDYFSIDDIDYVEALPPNSELVSLEESSSPFPIPVEDSDSFFEKSDTSLSYSDNSLPEFETFSDHTKETSSGSTTTHDDKSLPESGLEVSFPFETRNKIIDPGIFFEVQSKNFLSRDAFYISFIRDLLCPVIEILLPFSSENEDQVFNPGDIPFLEVPFLHFYPP
nr:hypothetical protein [Tanacetum cinerariifolium]